MRNFRFFGIPALACLIVLEFLLTGSVAVVRAADPATSVEGFWDGRFGVPGVNGDLSAISVMGGDVYVGGQFRVAGNVSANNIARWDGQHWASVGVGLGSCPDDPASCGDRVLSLAVRSTAGGSELIAGGTFGGGLLYRWDGSQWAEIPGLPRSAGVHVSALASDDGELYVGGLFSEAGGTHVNNVARWDGSGWTPLTDGVSSSVTAILVHGDDVYVAGQFSAAGNTSANGIAKWNRTNSTWTPLGEGLFGIHALAFVGNSLYAGGYFPSIDNTSNIARWDGSTWSAVGNGLGYFYPLPGFQLGVSSLAVLDGKLYAGGDFDVGTASSWGGNLAVWDGTTWSAVAATEMPMVQAMAVQGKDLYFGADFSWPTYYRQPQIVTPILPNIKRWDGVTVSPLADGLNQGIVGDVTAVLVQNNNVYVAADHRVLEWDPVDSDWTQIGQLYPCRLNQYPMCSGRVFALAWDNGFLYAGGSFTAVNGVSANNIARWNGSQWEPLGDGIVAGPPVRVKALAVRNGQLYAGGYSFRVARWDGAGWTRVPGGPNKVEALEFVGKNLYAGGSFGSKRYPAAYLVRFKRNRWHAVGNELSGSVHTLKRYGDSLLVGGDFDKAIPGRGLLRWDGKSWSRLAGWNACCVNSIATVGDNIYIGGNFAKAFKGKTFNHVALYNGIEWCPLGAGTDSDVRTIAAAGKDVYVGGTFLFADDKVSNRFGIWHNLSAAP